MRTIILIVLTSFLQSNKILCQSGFGNVFPIPLIISNEDLNFRQCPVENGAYVHTSNCSLFHMCTFGIHTIYSCIDGFFFNPTSGQCQYLSTENDVKCDTILKQMMNTDFFPADDSVKGYDYYHRRKSSTSKCTQTGIYPDILDCSLFHYCHQNNQHEILKCPNGLHFDPKTFMCSAPQLVNCQYEPLTIPENETDNICRDSPPGTYLPLLNTLDEFIVCENDGRSISMKCKSGFIYNALTTACEKGPCTFDSTLCQNEGHCIDEPTIEKGFKCICSNEFYGEYCENVVEPEETTETSSINLFQQSNTDETTHIPYIGKVNLLRKNQFITTNKNSKDRLQDKSLFQETTEQQQHVEQMIKLILIIVLTLIGLILLGSIGFGVVTYTRFIRYSSEETVGKWTILSDESKV